MKKRYIELSRALFFPAIVAAFIFAGFAAILTPAKVSIIVDGKKVETTTKKLLVRDVLKENKIRVSKHDYIYPSLDSCIGDFSGKIVVKKAKRVILVKRGFREEHFTFASDADSLLKELRVPEKSACLAFASDKLSSSSVVTFEKVKSITQDSLVYFDERGRVVSKNVRAGVKLVRIRKIYRGDTLLATNVVQEKVLKKPLVAKSSVVVARGKRRVVSRGSSRENLSATKEFYMLSTAYAPGAGAGYITATGRRAGYGIVAVDPRVIPLGTRLYIPGYGYAIAADTGSAIKGFRIDLCFNTREQAVKWGRRRVKVYIVD